MPGIYVHFPFCIRKCLYCDFNSYAGLDSFQRPYILSLEIELLEKSAAIRQQRPEAEFDTIFFGGGTPTVLPSGMLEWCLRGIYQNFSVTPDAEVSIEANPGTVTRESLSDLRRAGFNRISIGVQTFDPRLLKVIGRIHGPVEADKAITSAAQAGFENISLDIMFGLPWQTVPQLLTDLKMALEYRPAHLSLYSLIIEEGTPFFKAAAEGTIVLPDEDTTARMYEEAGRLLDDVGYAHYEISNWAREIQPHIVDSKRLDDGFLTWSSPGLRKRLIGRMVAYCRHNLNYWGAGEYIGLGAGAHSYWDGCRFSNIRQPEDYILAAEKRQVLVEDTEQIGAETAMSEYMILSLRTAAGARADEFRMRFGLDMFKYYSAEIESVAQAGLVDADRDSLRLSVRGRILGNEVFMRFVGSV